MALNLVFLAFVCALAGYGAFYSKRRIYRSIDRMLDCVLSREEIEYSDVKEGELSALANKITRIKEVLEKQIQSAEEEKRQIQRCAWRNPHCGEIASSASGQDQYRYQYPEPAQKYL